MTKRLTPIKQRKLMQRLTAFGFEVPFPGGKHEPNFSFKEKSSIIRNKEELKMIL